MSRTFDERSIGQAERLLQEGMALDRCRQCGCMQDALDGISASLRSPMMKSFTPLRDSVDSWQEQMEPVAYTWLGCERCIGADALAVFSEALLPKKP